MRILVALAAIMVMVVAAPTAQANDNTPHDYFIDVGNTTDAQEWDPDDSHNVCMSGEFGAELGASQEANAIDSMQDALDEIIFGSAFPNAAVDTDFGTCGDFDAMGDWLDANQNVPTFCNAVQRSAAGARRSGSR